MSGFGNIPPFYVRSTFGTSLAALPVAGSAVLTDKVVNVTTGGVAQTETLQQILTLFDATVHAFTATARAAGVAAFVTFTVPADTLRTASTEAVQILLDASATQQWATGPITTQREVLVKAPTLSAVGASVITTAGTLVIDNSPQAGANVTLTKAYALWVQAGNSLFGGNVTLISATPVVQVENTSTYHVRVAVIANAGRVGSTNATPLEILCNSLIPLKWDTSGRWYIWAGTNKSSGLATLVGGTVTVANTLVTANSRILLTSQVDGGTAGWLRISGRTAATSFTITSSDAGDTSSVAWFMTEPV